MKLILTPLLWGKKISFGPKTIGLSFNISCMNEMGFKQLPGIEENKFVQGHFKFVLKAACMITSMKGTKSLTNKVQIIIIKKKKVQIIETNT